MPFPKFVNMTKIHAVSNFARLLHHYKTMYARPGGTHVHGPEKQP